MNKKMAVAICAVAGFSLMMALQSFMGRHGLAGQTERPRYLACKTEALPAGYNPFGPKVQVTNDTGATLKRNQFVFYTLNGDSGKFVLTADLAPNASVKNLVSAYTGTPDCQAWVMQ